MFQVDETIPSKHLLERSVKALLCIACLTYNQPLPAKATNPVGLQYYVWPDFRAGQLTGINITIAMRATDDGITVIELPDRFGGVADHWRYLTDFKIDGASQFSHTRGLITLRSAPRAKITLSYKAVTAYVANPTAADGNPYQGPIIQHDWFSSLGEFLFAKPVGKLRSRAQLHWRGWPRNWTIVSTTDNRIVTVADIAESSIIGGKKLIVETHRINGGTLRVALNKSFPWKFSTYTTQVRYIINSQRGFWNDRHGDYSATLINVDPSPGLSFTGGTGRAHGFVQYATPDTELNTLTRILAHEHIHNWIPTQVGEMPDTEPASLFWFSEGFADFYTARTLFKAGIWTESDFLNDLNRALSGAATTPERVIDNDQITRQFWNEPAIQQLAYDRGHIFAHLLNHALRQARKPGLDAIIFAMRSSFKAAPPEGKPRLIDNLLKQLDVVGFDARSMITEHITQGSQIFLPSNQFENCLTFETNTQSTFELGFDDETTSRTGLFVGVDPNGPAYDRGLRDRMRLIKSLNSTSKRPQDPFTYQVSDSNSKFTIKWLPEARNELTYQRARIIGTPKQCRDSILGQTARRPTKS